MHNLTYLAGLIESSVQEIQAVCQILGFNIKGEEVSSDRVPDLENFFMELAATAEDKGVSLGQAAQAIAAQYNQSGEQPLDRSEAVFAKMFGIDPNAIQPGSLIYQTWQLWQGGVLPETEVTATLLRAGRAEMIGHFYYNGTEGKSEEGSTLSQAADLELKMLESFYQNSSQLEIGQAPSLGAGSTSPKALTGA